MLSLGSAGRTSRPRERSPFRPCKRVTVPRTHSTSGGLPYLRPHSSEHCPAVPLPLRRTSGLTSQAMRWPELKPRVNAQPTEPSTHPDQLLLSIFPASIVDFCLLVSYWGHILFLKDGKRSISDLTCFSYNDFDPAVAERVWMDWRVQRSVDCNTETMFDFRWVTGLCFSFLTWNPRIMVRFCGTPPTTHLERCPLHGKHAAFTVGWWLKNLLSLFLPPSWPLYGQSTGSYLSLVNTRAGGWLLGCIYPLVLP